MPVPQLPVELIQLIVADPVLTKADLQSLSLTTRAFPPLVRPHLFKQLEIPLGWIPEDDAFPNPDDYGPALTLDEMDRLMSLRRRPDLAELVKEVCIAKDNWLEPPPGSIRVTAHDLMQLVYIIFTHLEEVGTTEEDPLIAPPRRPLPCCRTLHTLRNVIIDAHTWISLQTCSALRRLSIAELSLRHGVPAMPPSLLFRLETLELDEVYEYPTYGAFLRPFLHACGPNLKHLWLGSNYDDFPDLSMLPKLVSLVVQMIDDDAFLAEAGENLDEWLATALPTCVALERLTIASDYVGHKLKLGRSPQRLLAMPEVAAALPATLKRVDFDRPLHDGDLEAALSNNKSVQVIGMPTQQGVHPSLDFCRRRGIKVVATGLSNWPA